MESNSKREVVAIVSYPTDSHAQYVMEKLAKKNIRCVILNIGEFPQEFEIGLTIESDRRNNMCFSLDGEKINSEMFHSVWWRRPLGAYREESFDPIVKYVSSESEAVIRSIPDFLPHAVWVSDPSATREAGRKPRQLRIASALGLRIPRTLISNSPESVRNFLLESGTMPLVMKAVNSAFIRVNPKAKDTEKMNRVIYTKLVTPEFINANLDHITSCPFILQEAIAKEMDIRVTVVGDRVFAMSIIANMPEGSLETVDWRRMDAERIYSPHILLDKIASACVSVTKQLGLKFGCIDLGFSEREGYTFFEVNPQGQWLVSEQVLGYPIADAVVDLLTEGLI